MDSWFEKCLAEKKIMKIGLQPDLVEKELHEADFDAKSAVASISENNFKWATVQAYYAMFHTAKALVLSKGYREKSHACLLVALKTLFVDAALLESKHFTNFRDCMDLRHDADYGLVYSESSARNAAEWATEFLKEARKIIKS